MSTRGFCFEKVTDAADFLCGYLPRVTGENASDVPERLSNMHTVTINGKLSDLLIVPRSPHLQHGYAPPHFSEDLDVPEKNDRVGNGGDIGLGDGRPAH